MTVDEPRRGRMLGAAFNAVDAGGIANGRAQAEGAVLIESVDERLAVVIVVNAGADANGGFGIG